MDDLGVMTSTGIAGLRPFWPSDYSGLIVRHLMRHPGLCRGRHVLDLGTGSGVLAGTALQLGATDVVATDLDPDALHLAEDRLARIAPEARVQLGQGAMWDAVESDLRFDLVLANLPNFPAEQLQSGSRAAFWSVGGEDGRKVLDPFLAGLPKRLRQGGSAVFTQNRCVGLRMTLDRLAEAGCGARVVETALVPVGPDKLAALSRISHEPEGLIEMAGFVFLEVVLVVVESEGPERRSISGREKTA
ncbi:50S ribosomal protein L11 methyltransferase [Roseovarius litoreus]|uniref:50S ribosomal protein L11 methyltransferase n=1 Tax=Roseovarius litoreus TaxID=1155722 RepID=UPI00165F448D|nr:50S ribosomal protein L11 methyltransferase [Roseovarius litoreus]